MNEIYFDNSATTKPVPEVVQEMLYMVTECYGNPSSLHKKGVEAEQKVKQAREQIARALKVNEKEIVFTSSGTEANNIAIIGIAKAYHRKGKHIITTKVEHPSVLQPFSALEKEGYEVTYIDVEATGTVKLEALKGAIRSDTTLVSIMHINNEVGALNDVVHIGKIIKEKNADTLFHVDGIQSFGKVMIQPNKMNIDLFTMSSHKLHGPKGVGALYAKKGIKISPIVFGGGQELGLRSGTENTPGIVGFGKAVELAHQNLQQNHEKVFQVKKRMQEGLKNTFNEIVFLGPSLEEGLPYILNVAFVGIRSEVLLHALEDQGIYVSSGSACSSHKPKTSHVLSAMAVDIKCMESSVRFSFSRFNTIEEAEECIERMKPIITMLRRFQRR